MNLSDSPYPAEKIESLLREGQYEKVYQECSRYFVQDCHDIRNIDFLSRALVENLIQSSDGTATPRILDDLLQAIRFGAVPEIASSSFFPLYEAFLAERYQELKDPGRLVFIIGTGRSGSTTIAGALEKIPGSLVTHERAPILYWENAETQLQFHLRFLELSRRYFRFVIDASHWWLPHLQYLEQAVGDFDVIFLKRRMPDTVQSFLKIKGTDRGSINHWTNHQGRYWSKNFWDKCYPDVIDFSEIGNSTNEFYMKSASIFCISKYVELYRRQARQYLEKSRGLSLDLETLASGAVKNSLFNLLDCEFEWSPTQLNRGSIQHSMQRDIFSKPLA